MYKSLDNRLRVLRVAVLQVALDTDDLHRALSLAAKLSFETKCENLWIEAGTPLIKAWGIHSVSLLKNITGCIVVADTKTMDTGGFEAEIMLRAGADVVTVLGLADDSTIIDALEKTRSYNKLLAVDLINHPKPFERAFELDRLGVDIILYHIGIDVQKKRGITAAVLIEEIKSLRNRIKAKIAVAGGIRHGQAAPLVKAGADIIIVGGAITRAQDPVKSTKMFLEEIRNM